MIGTTLDISSMNLPLVFGSYLNQVRRINVVRGVYDPV